jgi:hypothetical protein
MFKLPQVIVFAMIAFNITAFTLLLQFDFLIFNHPLEKLAAWAVTIWAWYVTYKRRNKVFKMF